MYIIEICIAFIAIGSSFVVIWNGYKHINATLYCQSCRAYYQDCAGKIVLSTLYGQDCVIKMTLKLFVLLRMFPADDPIAHL